MRGLRWIRLLAIATAAVILASCRSLTAPLATTATAVTVLPEDVVAREGDDESLTAALVSDFPVSLARDATAAVVSAAPAAEPAAVAPDPDAALVPTAAAKTSIRRHEGVVPAGLEAPCPPLPRLACRTCPPVAAGHAVFVPAAGCRSGACRTGGDPSGNCPTGSCQPVACLPCEPAVPVIRPCLVCDGGDHGAVAKAVGVDRLENLTAGDTVARYRPADDGPESDRVWITESNCACVYAPRFAAVREVVKPFEDAAPLGPGGLVNEELVELEVERQPVWGSVQNLAPEAARKALPGVAVQERLGPLAVDQGELPVEDDGVEGPAERLAIDQLELARLRQRPLAAVGFDVPVSWTCIKAANVLVNQKAAEVVAADRGTATLRFEEPGRAELTLCKRAGTDTARVGEELDFTIYMLNSGDRPLTNIVLADALPRRLELVPGSAAASLPAEFSTETGDDGSVVLTWRLSEPLPAGASGFVRFRVLVR
ncbi:MAG: hypothetical protein ACKOCX_04070 [Planctomycetota bacterium]